MRAISYRQVLFLGLMTMPITGHFLLVSPIIELAGKNAWLCILFTFPIGILFAYLLYRIYHLANGACLIEMIPKLLGRFLGSIGLLLFVCYGLYMLIVTLYCMVDFTVLIYLHHHTKLSIAAWIYLIAAYGVFTGIEAVARACEPLAMLLPFTGSSASIATMKFKDYSLLLPVLQDGMRPVLLGMMMTLAVYGELLVVMMYFFQRNKMASRKLFYVLACLIFFISLTFLGTITGCISILGVEASIAKPYPSYDVLKLVNFGFINRFDIYGIFTLITGGIIRLAFWQIAIVRAMTQLLRIVNPIWFHGIIITTVIYAVLWLIPDNLQFEQTWLMVYYPLTAWISIGLPCILWVVSEWKRSRTGAIASSTNSVSHKG